MKVCGSCGIKKVNAEFFKRGDGNGLRSQCKTCYRASGNRWAEENPEAYKRANRISTHNWRADDPERERQTQRRARLKFLLERPAEYLVKSARGRAAKLGVPFDLEPEDITIPEKCPVLGISLKLNTNARKRPDDMPSLDRIHPKLGYVKGNVCVISWRANKLKCNATLVELEALAKYVRSWDHLSQNGARKK